MCDPFKFVGNFGIFTIIKTLVWYDRTVLFVHNAGYGNYYLVTLINDENGTETWEGVKLDMITLDNILKDEDNKLSAKEIDNIFNVSDNLKWRIIA